MIHGNAVNKRINAFVFPTIWKMYCKKQKILYEVSSKTKVTFAC